MPLAFTNDPDAERGLLRPTATPCDFSASLLGEVEDSGADWTAKGSLNTVPANDLDWCKVHVTDGSCWLDLNVEPNCEYYTPRWMED